MNPRKKSTDVILPGSRGLAEMGSEDIIARFRLHQIYEKLFTFTEKRKVFSGANEKLLDCKSMHNSGDDRLGTAVGEEYIMGMDHRPVPATRHMSRREGRALLHLARFLPTRLS